MFLIQADKLSSAHLLLQQKHHSRTLKALANGMADSPLSIAANIAGILTFVAALLAFIYARYVILRNGKQEIVQNARSIYDSIQECKALHDSFQSSFQLDGQAWAPPPIDEHLQEMLRQLCEVEVQAMSLLFRTYSGDESPREENVRLDRLMQRLRKNEHFVEFVMTRGPGIYVHSKWVSKTQPTDKKYEWISSREYNMMLDIRRILGPETVFQKLRNFWILLWGSLRFSLSGGTPKYLLRWYTVRREMLQLAEKRAMVRSQLSFQQLRLVDK